MEIIGTIKTKLAIESGTSKAGKEWSKQSIVIDTNKDWNSDVCISFFGADKLALVDSFEVGTDVKVGINVSSREYNGKYYHNIDGWRIDSIDAPKSAVVDVTAPAQSDDLPF
ncbi:hypothetical protein [uncultured Mediterranean phage uvMED]|nr:hypothetical protein [uncultured Mediterranean phage uvMED]